MTKDEALKLALDWFKCYADKSMSRNNAEALADEVVDALKEALALMSTTCEVQPEQEPSQFGSLKMQALILAELAQPEREWVELTDASIQDCYNTAYKVVQGRRLEVTFARAVLAKSKELNT